jgi:signal transduction histidine kinase
MPLTVQAVLDLPRLGWGGVAIVLFALGFVLPLRAAAHLEWAAVAQASLQFLPALLFVVAFSSVVARERAARAEVERLAAALGEANRKLREHAAQAEELATAKERNRLAREIHDTLGHYLTVINVQLEAAQAVMEGDHARAGAAVGKARALAKDGLAEVRRSVAALRASPVESRPLPEAIAALAEECRAGGLVVDYQVQGAPRRLPLPAETALYRTAQEALTNVRKHARASRVDLRLDYAPAGRVRLMVQDNGVGAQNPDDSEGRFGLLGMRERIQLLGGEVRILTAPGQGFKLDVDVPGVN